MRRRDTHAALRLMHKLLKKQGFAPKLLVTDKLGSYGSAFRRLRLTCRHGKYLSEMPTIRSLLRSAAGSCFSEKSRCCRNHYVARQSSRLLSEAA